MCIDDGGCVVAVSRTEYTRQLSRDLLQQPVAPSVLVIRTPLGFSQTPLAVVLARSYRTAHIRLIYPSVDKRVGGMQVGLKVNTCRHEHFRDDYCTHCKALNKCPVLFTFTIADCSRFYRATQLC